jgi:hypothetical protein
MTWRFARDSAEDDDGLATRPEQYDDFMGQTWKSKC